MNGFSRWVDNLTTWLKLKWWNLLGVESEQQMNKVLRRFISRSIAPCLISLQFWVYYYFFWFTQQKYSKECLFHLLVCAALDSMVLWCKHEASNNPGYVNNSVHMKPCKKCENTLKTS